MNVNEKEREVGRCLEMMWQRFVRLEMNEPWWFLNQDESLFFS